jgi:uncharacterized protein YjbI with pentapeptide repeats
LWAIRLGILLGLLVAIGYSYGVTLWDWIKLLIVPAAIAGAGLWFNTQQREREQQIADNRAQDDSLQAYLDGMSQLLTDKDLPLHSAQPGDSLSTVARARTLTVLGRLDEDRKRSVLQFLYEAGLIYKGQTILNEADLIERRHRIVRLEQANLIGANLNRAFLHRSDLREAILRWAILGGANLSRALLSGADLHGSFLSNADLSGADLSEANLSEAILAGANLSGAVLSNADLREAILYRTNLHESLLSNADLSGAELKKTNLSGAWEWTEGQLSEARTLEGATMPDGQKYEDWLKDREPPEG